MSRVLLIHWNQVEAQARGERLRRGGHVVETYWHTDGTGAAEVRANPPDVFVIDLSRLPSHGRNTAIWLRQQKGTRHVPIVFVGGEPEKVRRAREVIPDATFTEWRRIRGAVRTAARRRNKSPIVPPTPGFYSKTPLSKKLGMRPRDVVALLGAPRDSVKTLAELPVGVRLKRRAGKGANVVLLFVASRRDLDRRFSAALETMIVGGSMWIVWPKRSSGVASDLTQPVVRAYGMERGLVDYKVASVDETWTGLRFARKRSRK